MVKSRGKALSKDDERKQMALLKKQDRAVKSSLRKSENRKRGRQTMGEDAQFEAVLEELGVRVVSVQGDGNCLFRSMADQLEGNPAQHWHYRKLVVEYIENHREDFEPFMEDDEPFDAYVARLGRDGEWGGHQELYAASRMLGASFVIHQFESPRFVIEAPTCAGSSAAAPFALHLSYHGEEHYNSVRSLDDPALPGTAARPIALRLGAEAAAEASGRSGGSTRTSAEKLVARAVPSASAEVVRRTLQDVGGDADAAVELLVSGYIPPPDGEDDREDDHEAQLDQGGAEGELAALEAVQAAEVAEAADVAAALRAVDEADYSSSQASRRGRGKKNADKKGSGDGADRAPTRQEICPCGSQKK